ncbi:MAG: tRNA (N(6)-L-threonylcarbamoyladenosine(37)-C(2))-methylthiotransferase MtaB, partial [Eubacteriales bacterium]
FGITTDIIVGFPGETDEDFENSLELIKKAKFSKVHAFRYSKRSGTVAEKMERQIRGEVKNARVKKMIEFSEDIAHEYFDSQRGTVRSILCERFENGHLEGYTENYIKTYVQMSEENAKKLYGKFLQVLLLKPFNEGMIGEEMAK